MFSPITQRTIVHLDLDAFFVSVECLKNPKLKGIPLLVGGSSDRAVVAACSYEARKFGIRSAMPMKFAKRLCPHAVIIGGDMENYGKYSSLVTEIISDKVPVFEKSSIDEFYVDMTGMDRFYSCARYTHELKKTITKESGLPITYAMSSNKLVSKVGTDEAKPNGQLIIPFGEEKNFLAPLSVKKIPMIGKQTAELLRQMGVETVRTLSEIPVHYLQNLLGKNGIELWRRANAIDESPVTPYHEQKSISTENTFPNDTIDIGFLMTELTRMTEKIGFELRQQSKLTGCITVKIRYSDFDTVTKQYSIPFTSADHILLKLAKTLFGKLYDRRLLVRLLGVRFTHLVPGNYQIHLFDDTSEMIRLYQSIDHIKNRFGSHLLMRGSAL
ncbi:MAG TPA: DNA polymerase IV [Flavitalea sp.]|nr:DNA polymerase IV [Flavitalea sp.]